MTIFEAKVKTTKENEKGILKAVNEKYAVCGAVSFADAEKSVAEYMVGARDLNVIALAKKTVAEIILKNKGNKLWYVTVEVMVVDGEREKKMPVLYLIEAADTKEASTIALGNYEVTDSEVVKVVDSKMLDVIKAYTPEEAN